MSQEKTRREAQGRERRHGLEERVTQESRMPQERARREIRGREGSLQPELRIEGWETGRPRQTGEPVYRDSFRDSSRRKQPGPRRRTGTTTPGYSREMRSKTVVSKKRKKRKQKKGSFFGKCVKLLTVIAGSVLLLSLAFKIIEDNPWLHRKPGKEKTGDMEQAATMPQKSGAILDPEVEESLKRLTEEDDRAREILENTGNYPEQLLESLSNNPELLEFVLDYPEKKDTSPADTIGDVKKGTVPLLLQWDERWGYGEYGGGLLACTGCGPTCLSMVIAGLTGDDSITPYTVARYAQENGYYEAGAGTKWSLMTEGAARFGIQGREISPDESTVTGELDAGHPIICSMGPGDFTKVGHFIVLTGRKDGKIQVNDPNSRIRSEKLWEFDDLKRQMRNLWAFE